MPDALSLLGDDRWYFSLDKGFGGHALLDPDGLATELADWFTARRFAPEVVAFRLARERAEFDAAMRRSDEAVQVLPLSPVHTPGEPSIGSRSI